MKKTNDIGKFEKEYEVWEKYPNGGAEGDYCTIADVVYLWNPIDNKWEREIKENHSHENHEVDGDVIIREDLLVGGKIYAYGIEQPAKGLFENEAQLLRAYPDYKCHRGDWALVFSEVQEPEPQAKQTFKVYRWACSGWYDTHRTTEVEVDAKAFIGREEFDRMLLEGYVYGGFKTKQSPVQKIERNTFFLVKESGAYPNLGNITVPTSGIKMSNGLAVVRCEIHNGVKKWFSESVLRDNSQRISVAELEMVPAESYYDGTDYTLIGDLGIVIGKVKTFSDATKKAFTQILYTHCRLKGGALDTNNVDFVKPHIYFRRKTDDTPINSTPAFTWTKWDVLRDYDEIFSRAGLSTDSNPYLSDRSHSPFTQNMQNTLYAECVEGLRLESRIDSGKRWVMLQQGWDYSRKHALFIFAPMGDKIAEGIQTNAQEFIVESGGVQPTGKKHYDLDNGIVKVSFTLDWDKYKTYFPSDLFRPNMTDMRMLINPTASKDPHIGNKIILRTGDKVMLCGASFAVQQNGWFELACARLGLRPFNKSQGGRSIVWMANEFLKASGGNHGPLFMEGGRDVFNEVKGLVIMHVHNMNVLLPLAVSNSRDVAYYKKKVSFASTEYADAFDYVIKQYKQWCYEQTGEETAHDGQGKNTYGKKSAQILICSHWHSGREEYNRTSRLLAERFGLPYCAFDDNLGVTKYDKITANTNYDGQLTPIAKLYNPTVLMSQFVADNPLNGKTEVIDGVMWGFHPQWRSKTTDYGHGLDFGDYYYPDVQYVLSNTFASCVSGALEDKTSETYIELLK